MGRVFKPEDIARGRKRVIEDAVRDLNPGIKEATVRILESGVDKESEERLVRLLGEEGAKHLIKRIKKASVK